MGKQRTIAEMYTTYLGKKAMLTVLDCQAYTKTIPKDGRQVEVPATTGIRVPVRIVDTCNWWGNEYALIRPLRGQGACWVEINDKLTLLADDQDWPEVEAYEPPTPLDEL